MYRRCMLIYGVCLLCCLLLRTVLCWLANRGESRLREKRKTGFKKTAICTVCLGSLQVTSTLLHQQMAIFPQLFFVFFVFVFSVQSKKQAMHWTDWQYTFMFLFFVCVWTPLTVQLDKRMHYPSLWCMRLQFMAEIGATPWKLSLNSCLFHDNNICFPFKNMYALVK